MTMLLSTLVLNLQMIFGLGNVTPAQVNAAMIQAQLNGNIVVVDTLTIM